MLTQFQCRQQIRGRLWGYYHAPSRDEDYLDRPAEDMDQGSEGQGVPGTSPGLQLGQWE
jgi:hypothetical protein